MEGPNHKISWSSIIPECWSTPARNSNFLCLSISTVFCVRSEYTDRARTSLSSDWAPRSRSPKMEGNLLEVEITWPTTLTLDECLDVDFLELLRLFPPCCDRMDTMFTGKCRLLFRHFRVGLHKSQSIVLLLVVGAHRTWHIAHRTRPGDFQISCCCSAAPWTETLYSLRLWVSSWLVGKEQTGSKMKTNQPISSFWCNLNYLIIDSLLPDCLS